MSIHSPILPATAMAWSVRPFGACGFPLAGRGPATLVCGAATDGGFNCPDHRAWLDAKWRRANKRWRGGDA